MAKTESASRKPKSQVGRSVGAHSPRTKLRPDGERVLPARARSFRLSFAMKLDFLRLRIDRSMTFHFPGKMKLHTRGCIIRRFHELHLLKIQREPFIQNQENRSCKSSLAPWKMRSGSLPSIAIT